MENVKQKTFTIFLDIDGVLHTGTPLFHLLPNFVIMCYALLERIGYRKIELVISSSWRHRGEKNVFSDLIQHDGSCYLRKWTENGRITVHSTGQDIQVPLEKHFSIDGLEIEHGGFEDNRLLEVKRYIEQNRIDTEHMFVLDDLPSLFFDVSEEALEQTARRIRFRKIFLVPPYYQNIDEDYQFDPVSQSIKQSFVNCESDGLDINVTFNALVDRFSVYDLLDIPRKATINQKEEL